VAIVETDVSDAIRAKPSAYDAILLDVDNGPSALTTFKNRRLYSAEGLERARNALRPRAVLAVWSTFQDAKFTARLRTVGFDPAAKRVLAGDGSRRRHVIWLARRVSEE
jgi:spermidine synthase